MLVCSSPKLIAAYHVLHRLSDPRHPPCALIRFKKFEIAVMLPPLLIFDTLVRSLSQYVKELYQYADLLMCKFANEWQMLRL